MLAQNTPQCKEDLPELTIRFARSSVRLFTDVGVWRRSFLVVMTISRWVSTKMNHNDKHDTDQTKQGYQIVDPGLLNTDHKQSNDLLVKYLSYLIKIMPRIFPVPSGILMTVISVKYIGDPYPAIGLYVKKDTSRAEDIELMDISLRMERAVEQFVLEMGLEKLSELSQVEDLTWNEIDNSYSNKP